MRSLYKILTRTNLFIDVRMVYSFLKMFNYSCQNSENTRMILCDNSDMRGMKNSD